MGQCHGRPGAAGRRGLLQQFRGRVFRLLVLPRWARPGHVHVQVWTHNATTNAWAMFAVTFTVSSASEHYVEAPILNQSMAQPFTLSGWAIEPADLRVLVSTPCMLRPTATSAPGRRSTLWAPRPMAMPEATWRPAAARASSIPAFICRSPASSPGGINSSSAPTRRRRRLAHSHAERVRRHSDECAEHHAHRVRHRRDLRQWAQLRGGREHPSPAVRRVVSAWDRGLADRRARRGLDLRGLGRRVLRRRDLRRHAKWRPLCVCDIHQDADRGDDHLLPHGRDRLSARALPTRPARQVIGTTTCPSAKPTARACRQRQRTRCGSEESNSTRSRRCTVRGAVLPQHLGALHPGQSSGTGALRHPELEQIYVPPGTIRSGS